MTTKITFTLDGKEVRRSRAKPSGKLRSAKAPRSRTCAGTRRRDTVPTAIAALAWWKSKASAFLRHRVNASLHRA